MRKDYSSFNLIVVKENRLSSYRDLLAIFSFLWDVQSLLHPRVYRVWWSSSVFTFTFIQWLVWDPVASFSRSIIIISARHETRLPHSVMWCALVHRRSPFLIIIIIRSSSGGGGGRSGQTVADSLSFSRGCTVLPEGNGGESFRGPFPEKRTRTERIDADFFDTICAVSEPDMLKTRQNEWHMHVRTGKSFMPLSNMHVNFCCIGSDAFCSCLCARGQSWSSIQSVRFSRC